MPSAVASQVVVSLLEAGARIIVDVSYVPDPLAAKGLAEKTGALLLVDAGLAPGLSNMLLYHSSTGMEEPRESLIYVGGIAAEASTAPLGLVASWNIEDLLEEYTRPARARIDGSLVELDPIADSTRVEVPGSGVFDALPTDGLRTLLVTLREPRTMVEYTLRYPGHVEALRELRTLGLLDDRSYVVEGCSSSPKMLLARLLEERLPRSGDRVVLYTRAAGRGRGGETVVEYFADVTQAELGLSSATALAFLTGFMHAWFVDRVYRLRSSLGKGVIPPEVLHEHLFEALGELRARGVVFSRRVCVEE